MLATACQELLDASLQPDAVCYGSVLNACAQAHESELAEHWLSQMISVTLARFHEFVPYPQLNSQPVLCYVLRYER